MGVAESATSEQVLDQLLEDGKLEPFIAGTYRIPLSEARGMVNRLRAAKQRPARWGERFVVCHVCGDHLNLVELRSAKEYGTEPEAPQILTTGTFRPHRCRETWPFKPEGEGA